MEKKEIQKERAVLLLMEMALLHIEKALGTKQMVTGRS